MKISKLSNQTNSQDSQAVNSRVFVGNLNTFQCSKSDVERTFQRYGRLVGISMHKGYAFVQFTNPSDARNACHGENGRLLLNQILDVNMVAEPKPHQGVINKVKQTPVSPRTDWDFYYNNDCSIELTDGEAENLNNPNSIGGQFKVYSNPDILICGNCREMFSDLSDLLEHKRSYCKLRFTCKCEDQMSSKNLYPTTKLLCVVCKDSFNNPWDLMVHAQAAHMVNIYEIGESDDDEESVGKSSEASTSAKGSVHDDESLSNASACSSSSNTSPKTICSHAKTSSDESTALMLVDDEDLDREILLHLSKQKIMELAEQNGQISNLIEGNYIHKLTADITVAG
ncbi:unnamed protein product [Diamesa hyperborea]